MTQHRILRTSSLVLGLGFLLALVFPLAPIACTGGSDDDDSTPGDDDEASSTPAGDDDSGDDDATTNSPGDDDSGGDDDAATTSPGGDDDETSPPEQTVTPTPDPCLVTSLYGTVTVNCCTPPAIPVYSEVRSAVFAPTCLNCHSTTKEGAARNGAPAWVNFDTAELAAGEGNEDRYPDPPSYYVQVVFTGYMPRDPYKNILTQEDKDLFYRWELCGHPE